MSIVLLLGGNTPQGNPEHRYLCNAFLNRFGDQIKHVITAEPVTRTFNQRLKRLLKRGHYLERLARWHYAGGYGPDTAQLQQLLLPNEQTPTMPGEGRHSHVVSHNSPACEAILDRIKPDVIVVYGTRIIRSNIFERARIISLNMHTGLSPWYRGDSTLFWPIYYDDADKLGVTVHELVAAVDGGAIAATAPVHYEPGDGEAQLFAKGVKAGTAIYLDCVAQALAGKLECRPQDLSLGREFSWTHRTVAAERRVLDQLDQWARSA